MAKSVPLDDDYTYENSGLDGFMVRQQERVSPLAVLERAGGELNFDNQQIGGAMADNLNVTGVMTVGNIKIDGEKGRISVLSNNKEIISIDGENGKLSLFENGRETVSLDGNIGRIAVSKNGEEIIVLDSEEGEFFVSDGTNKFIRINSIEGRMIASDGDRDFLVIGEDY